jgi:hypothetical protein
MGLRRVYVGFQVVQGTIQGVDLGFIRRSLFVVCR